MMIPHKLKHLSPLCKKNFHSLFRHNNTSVLLAMDQGIEHGLSAFTQNYFRSPQNIADFILQTKLSGLIAPMGLLQGIVNLDSYQHDFPIILKLNHHSVFNSIAGGDMAPTIMYDIAQAFKLGCSAIGYTVYPGTISFHQQLHDLSIVLEQADKYGLIVIVWVYLRSKLTVAEFNPYCYQKIADAIYLISNLGAHIIKSKRPESGLHNSHATHDYADKQDMISGTDVEQIKYILQAADGIPVLFSGGQYIAESEFLQENKILHQAGCRGTIIGRNLFQRPLQQATDLALDLQKIYNSQYN